MAQMAALAASETTLPTATTTPTIVGTPLPTPTATPVVYQVRAGDTLVTIAAAYGVAVEDLMAVNEISAQDVFVIQPGQMLFIPVETPGPTAATTSDSAAIRVGAPDLLAPADGATVACATNGTLLWDRVQFVKDSDKYLLHLGFVSGRSDDGEESVTWVLAQSGPVTQTEWQLDTTLCELAPADYDQQWRWWVEVVEDTGSGILSVSPPSEIHGFVWQ
jgi:LysM repeat protein